jgi:uncharacterized C2H2 Zn-finger protein
MKGGRLKCIKCDKSYAQRASIIRHYKEIHLTDTETRYRCRHCGQVNKRARYFREHLKRAHGYSAEMMDAEGIP